MKLTRRKVAWIGLSAVAGALVTVLLLNWRLEVQQARADFEWFSALGFPEPKGRPYARVATGAWSQTGNDAPRIHYLNGFLLATNGDAFTVFGLDLSIRTFTNTPAGTP